LLQNKGNYWLGKANFTKTKDLATDAGLLIHLLHIPVLFFLSGRGFIHYL
jgi:hypothetical protein